MVEALTLQLLCFLWRTIDIEHQAVMEQVYKYISGFLLIFSDGWVDATQWVFQWQKFEGCPKERDKYVTFVFNWRHILQFGVRTLRYISQCFLWGNSHAIQIYSMYTRMVLFQWIPRVPVANKGLGLGLDVRAQKFTYVSHGPMANNKASLQLTEFLANRHSARCHGRPPKSPPNLTLFVFFLGGKGTGRKHF